MRAIAHRRKLEASEVIDVEVEATAEDEESLVIETPDMKSRQVKLYASFRFLNFQFCFILTFYSYKSWPANSWWISSGLLLRLSWCTAVSLSKAPSSPTEVAIHTTLFGSHGYLLAACEDFCFSPFVTFYFLDIYFKTIFFSFFFSREAPSKRCAKNN